MGCVRFLTGVIGVAVLAVSLAAPAAAESGVSNGQRYTVALAAIDGDTADNVGHWTVQAGQLTGGDPQVTAAFNAASKASADYLIDRARDDAGPPPYPAGWEWTLKATSQPTFRPSAIAQLTTGVYYGKGAAHPVNYVSTVVIDSRTAKPITLAALFANLQDGLHRLSQQTKKIGIGSGPMSDQPGNAPVEENFANWIPTAQGMELHFADYQFGHGTPVTTVPWTALVDVLAPDMTVLAQS